MRYPIGADGVRAVGRSTGLMFLIVAGWAEASAQPPAIRIDEKHLVIEGDAGSFKTSWNFERPEAGLLLATLTLAAPQQARPPALQVRWDFPAVNLAGVWVSDNTKPNNDHQGIRIDSRAVLRAPLLMYLDPDDRNRVTFIMWYSVPMAGGKSEAAKRFMGKTLGFSQGLGAHILDPRYPEVREYLISLYEGAVRDWGVDGLKLDFIELFAPKDDTVLTAENGRDFASVDEAVDRLFTDIMTRLRAINPDIAIEFRQPYNGPLMRKYGNMLRGVDCPNAGPVNRKQIVDLRLLADHTAVHSDMFIWPPDEPLESAALQILNVLLSVPQVSVRLTEIPPAHREMIGFWMKYWRANRDVLLDGGFIPVAPAQNYPMISGHTARKWLSVIYQDMVVAPGDKVFREIDIINAKAAGDVVLRLENSFGPAAVTVRDCRGKSVREETRELAAGAHVFEVPASGLVEIRQPDGK